ncbi:MAG: protein translocase subunit SecF [Vicinamibacteraceae bacterium]|nr:protein translocase subunit SecF [Vicinamibacteraceae bacterium]
MRIFTNPNYDFLKWRWHAIALSLVVILAGVGVMATRGVPLGIDFSGGTIVIMRFAQPVTEEAVRNAVESLPGEKVVQQYGDPSLNEVLVRLPQTTDTEQGFQLEEGARQVVDAVRAANIGNFEVLSTEVVGPVIGAELQRKGIYATIASILGIMVYIAFRFRFSFAVGAIAATLHDLLVTLAFLTFFGYELSLNVIAAILTIVGYSVNDTIVIFDRVRENLRGMRRDKLDEVVNLSVNQTLGRTVITAGTTFFAVLGLYLFGGEVLEGFAFTMLVGIVSGTYSTVFIASAIAIIMSRRKAAVRAAAPETPAKGQARGQKSKKARAS